MARGAGPLALAGRVAVAALALVTLSAPTAFPAGGPVPEPRPRYYRPVVVDGFTFPVARTNWLSVIELAEDWHAPRMRLIDGTWRLVGVHEGNDVTAEKGTPVVSITAGTVEVVGWTFYSGTRVGVRGADGRFYFYAHLDDIAPGLSPGDAVEPGSVLGSLGNTGYGPPGHEDEFPPHLHVGIQDDDWVNPYPLLRRLYRASVRATTRGERRLAQLARAGDLGAYRRLAGKLYLER